MQEPMNRRRFLALSASVTPLTEVGGALENFSPHLSELAFATPITLDPYDKQPTTQRSNDCSHINECYDIPVYDTSLVETLLSTSHVLEPT
jgi:hypothetical protein